MGPRWKVALRRLRRYVREPQGLAVGTIIVLAGLPLGRWLNDAYPRWGETTVSVVAIVLSLLAWLFFVFLWDWLAIVREGAKRIAVLEGETALIQGRGWTLEIRQTPNGVRAAIDLDNKERGWPVDTHWDLLNPFGEEKRVIIHHADRVNIAAHWPGFAQVTWPLDFWGESIESGVYRIRWVEYGTVAVEHTFRVKRKRVKRAPQKQ